MKRLFLTLLILTPYLLNAQRDYVLEIDNKTKITLDEFRHIYFKNIPKKDHQVTKQDLDNYIDLFVNFKLRVHEAQVNGLDKKEEFIEELRKYRNQLAEPYMVDKDFSEKLYREAYDRKFTAVRASHILLKLLPEAKPADTLVQFKKAADIKKRIDKGESFEKLAKEFSDDPSVKQNSGDIGYFSSLQMVYPFEQAAYNTPVGKVSDPFRTQFGYHIIKVTDTINLKGPIDGYYVMIIDRGDSTHVYDPETPSFRIYQAYDSLKAGVSIHSVINRYSEDPDKVTKNGFLGNQEPGKLHPKMDSIFFRLKNKEFSKPFFVEPFQTWFIIYRADSRDFLPYEKYYDRIKAAYTKLPQNKLRTKSLVDKLLLEYKLVKDEKNLNIAIDTIKRAFQKKSNYSDNLIEYLNKPVFTLNNTHYTTQFEFVDFIMTEFANNQTDDIVAFCNANLEKFIQQFVLSYENSILEMKHPVFAFTVKEYHDGILLFKITDSIVWQKAINDSIGLQGYFEQNIENYKWAERTNALIIKSNKPQLQKKIEKELLAIFKKGELDSQKIESLKKKLKEPTLILTYQKGKFEKEQNQTVDKAENKLGLNHIGTTEKETVWVYVKGVEPPTPKNLNEIRGLVTADYQNYLEKIWLEELKQKYPYKVNRELIYTLAE